MCRAEKERQKKKGEKGEESIGWEQNFAKDYSVNSFSKIIRQKGIARSGSQTWTTLKAELSQHKANSRSRPVWGRLNSIEVSQEPCRWRQFKGL